MSGRRWLDAIERSADRVLEDLVDLDPTDITMRRASDGRSVWIEPTAPRFTSEEVLVQEEHILTWAMDAQADPPAPSTTVDRRGLDVLQADAAAAVAGDDRLVLVVGPAGAGKTRMLSAAVDDLHRQRPAAVRVGADGQGGPRPGAGHRHRRRHGRQVALRMGSTRPGGRGALAAAGGCDGGRGRGRDDRHPGVAPARHAGRDEQRWRLALVGDHRQLQAVGRGGLFHELTASGRVEELEHIHRFTEPWEAAASLHVACR